MATKYHNLSTADGKVNRNVVRGTRYGIVVADWNDEITYALADGALETLMEEGIEEEDILVVHVPGTVELTFAAARLLDERQWDAVIVIGCVVRGDTPHFDYVCQSVTQGVAMLNAKGEIPVIFSVLTTEDMQQARDRAGGKLGNKGVEGAYTAMRMVQVNLESLERKGK